MANEIEVSGKKYTSHVHEANWMILRDNPVYSKPSINFKKTSDITTVKRDDVKTYISQYKVIIDGSGWFYFIELKGWLPWKLAGNQLLKRIGGIINCEESDKLNKQQEEERAAAQKKAVPVPSVNTVLDTTSEDYMNFIRSKMIIKDDADKWNSKFNRLQFANPYNAIGTTREYLFFVKPDLHILSPGTVNLNPELSNDSFWLEMNARYSRVIRQLQSSADRSVMPFMPILTNAVAGPLDLPSSNAETTETGQTIYGTTIQYRQSSFKSDENYDFSLEFYDNQSAEIYHLFKMYDKYENLKTLGVVTPPTFGKSAGGVRVNKYTVDRVLHDQIGIFKIIVEEDMETILHYSYLCGCFPKSVPRDTFREVEPGLLRYSIDWHAQFVDDMNPEILIDFNELCKQFITPTKDNESMLWNSKLGVMNGNWTSCPYITIALDKSRPTGYKYKLKWFDRAK